MSGHTPAPSDPAADIQAKPWELLDEADQYQLEQIATAQSEAAHEAALKEYE
jgi:hypothetical protein